MSRNIIHVDFDKEMDIIYCILDGYDSDSLRNIDSEKIPGVVKRTDLESGECLGFIIHGASRLISTPILADAAKLMNFLSLSIDKTNELRLLVPFAA